MNKNKKILLIEDDPYTRDVYQEILQNNGFTVTTAEDGQEGLADILEGGFSLILLDVMMPKMDGLQVLANIKGKIPKNQNGPVVLLTNLGHDPIINEALRLGAKAFLIKSELNPDQLVLEINKLVI